MRIKSVILGLILVVVGIVMFSIATAGQKKERQLLQEQQKKTEKNINTLEKFVAGEINIDSFAKAVPSDDWESSFSIPEANKENTELKLITSTVCMGIGTTLLIWWPLLWIVRRTTEALSKLKKNDILTIECAKQTKTPCSRKRKLSKQAEQKHACTGRQRHYNIKSCRNRHRQRNHYNSGTKQQCRCVNVECVNVVASWVKFPLGVDKCKEDHAQTAEYRCQHHGSRRKTPIVNIV